MFTFTLQAARAQRADGFRRPASVLSAALVFALGWAGWIDSHAAADEKGPPSSDAARAQAAEQTATDDERRILAALDRPAKLTFTDTSLRDVATELETEFRIPVAIDFAALSEDAIPGDLPITFSMPEVKLRTALRFLLTPNGLTWIIHNDALVITTPDAVVKDGIVTRVYRVRDLIVENAEDLGDFLNIIDIITTTIVPESWDPQGGPGALQEFRDGLLLVSQSHDVHARIEALFAALRTAQFQQERGKDDHRFAPIPLNDRDLAAVWRKRLDERMDFHFVGMPLAAVAKKLSQHFNAPVVVDDIAVSQLDRKDADLVFYSRRDVKAGVGLSQMLQPQLDWYVHNEVLVLTSMEVGVNTVETRVYPVADLIYSEDVFGEFYEPDFDALIDVFQTQVSPDTWDWTGGPGTLAEHYYSDSLVVTQSRAVHSDIEALLANLRAKLPRAQRDRKPIPAESRQLKVLDFDDEIEAKSLLAALKELVQPEVWPRDTQEIDWQPFLEATPRDAPKSGKLYLQQPHAVAVIIDDLLRQIRSDTYRDIHFGYTRQYGWPRNTPNFVLPGTKEEVTIRAYLLKPRRAVFASSGIGPAWNPPVDNPPDGAMFADMLKKSIAPTTWGGQGLGRALGFPNLVIVRHTPEVQAQVAKLLHKLMKDSKGPFE